MPVIREISDLWVMSKEDPHWIRSRWSRCLSEWYTDEKELAKIKRKSKASAFTDASSFVAHRSELVARLTRSPRHISDTMPTPEAIVSWDGPTILVQLARSPGDELLHTYWRQLQKFSDRADLPPLRLQPCAFCLLHIFASY